MSEGHLPAISAAAFACVFLACSEGKREHAEHRGEALTGAPHDRTDTGLGDHHEDGDQELAADDLTQNDSVADAVQRGCSTTSVWGLATQLVGEIGCMIPGAMSRIDGIPGLQLGPAAFPYLQTSAALALVEAQKAGDAAMFINSGLRTLPQQYLLYRWYKSVRCGIAAAAPPGASNHEAAVAVDIRDYAVWRVTMQRHRYRWLGASDPVHFDYIGGDTIDMSRLSIRAFQQLWNRNNPTDLIAVDGVYGGETESHLLRSPVGGFSIGPACDVRGNSRVSVTGSARPVSRE